MFDQQITQVVKTCFFQSRLLWKVKAYFPLNDIESHPHVYNFLVWITVILCILVWISLLLQNAAACHLTGEETTVLASCQFQDPV